METEANERGDHGYISVGISRPGCETGNLLDHQGRRLVAEGLMMLINAFFS